MYFYFAAANIQSEVDQNLNEFDLESKKIIELGFWPGATGMAIRMYIQTLPYRFQKCCARSLFRCYYRDFRNLKRRITFRGVEDTIAIVHDVLYKNAFDPNI